MYQRILGLAAISSSLLVTSAAAQTFVEVEPNNGKSEATFINGIVPGDTIGGTTIGTDLTLGSTAAGTWDYFRIKAAPLPLGIYKYQLTQSPTDTGHLARIRGVDQTGTAGVGGTAGTTDSNLQSTVTVTPLLFNQWYAFGKQEEIYWANSGTGGTTNPYLVTFSATLVTPTTITPSFESANPITIRGTAAFDTHVHLYDGSLNLLPNGSNDDPYPAAGLSCKLTRTLAPGTYYMGISRTTACTNQPAAFDDNYVTALLADFPNVVVRGANNTAAAQDCSFEIVASNGTYPVANVIPGGTYYEVTWFKFTVANGAPPVVTPNDSCANAIDVGTGASSTGSFLNATNDGTASCDPGGASSRDVWYKMTNPSAVPRTLFADSCLSSSDTVITVFNACGGAELACNDDCGGNPCTGTTSCLSLVLNPGQSVHIRLSDKGIGVGQPYTLRTSLLYANDDCNTPVNLAGPGTYPFDTDGATTGSQGQLESLCLFSGDTGLDKDLWYTYTGTTNGTGTVSTCGLLTSPSTDTKISVYDGAGCPMTNSIACWDDDGAACGQSNLETTVTWPTVCGQLYTIQLGGYSPINDLAGSFVVTEVGSACATPFNVYCSGDGTDTTCPCSNPGLAGRGCDNTFATGGANLASSGIASVSSPTLVMNSTFAVPFGPGLYYEGNATALPGPNFGATFGNGLRCAGGATNRLEIRFADGAGTANSTVDLQAFGAAVAGNTYYYQQWYRDTGNVGSCAPGAGFNLSNAISLTWAP